MKLTPALFSLNISFSFFIFLGGIFLANATTAQEKSLVKSVDSVGRQVIKSVVENKKNDFKNKLKEQTSQFTDTAKRKLAVQVYGSKQLADSNKKKQAILDSIKKNKVFGLNNLAIENSTLVNGINQSLRKQPLLNNISVFGQVQLFNFPLAIDLSNNSGDFPSLDPLREVLFKVNLDKSQLTQVYKSDIEKVTPFQNMELSGMDVGSYLKKDIRSKLKPSTVIDPSRYQPPAMEDLDNT